MAIFVLNERVWSLTEDGLLLPILETTNILKLYIVSGNKDDISAVVNCEPTISVLCKVPDLRTSIPTLVLGLDPFDWYVHCRRTESVVMSITLTFATASGKSGN